MNDFAPPLRLVIPGKFWDSQIYSGTLYIFGLSAELIKLSWPRLIEDLPLPNGLKPTAALALMNNRALYEPGSQRLLADPDIRRLLIGKIQQLADLLLGMETKRESRMDRQDNPLPFPHNDSELYRSKLYVGGSSGLFSLKANPATRGRGNSIRHSDAPALAIAAKFSTMAQASGSDGLIETKLTRDDELTRDDTMRVLSPTPCVNCDFAFLSVVASESNGDIYLASFNRIPEDNDRPGRRRFVRVLDRIIPQEELFNKERYSGPSFRWGARDKLFRYTSDRIEVIRYVPRSEDTSVAKSTRRRNASVETNTPQFNFLDEIDIEGAGAGDAASVVSAKTASFGSVIEYDDKLFIVPTVGFPFFLQGEPTTWRVFPRSIDYRNHLHIIYEDRLEIFVFTHDYFVDQRTKLSGTEVGTPSDDEAYI